MCVTLKTWSDIGIYFEMTKFQMKSQLFQAQRIYIFKRFLVCWKDWMILIIRKIGVLKGNASHLISRNFVINMKLKACLISIHSIQVQKHLLKAVQCTFQSQSSYRAVLLKWEFFIKMRVAKSQPSFNIEESWFIKNVLFLSKNDFLFYYLKP